MHYIVLLFVRCLRFEANDKCAGEKRIRYGFTDKVDSLHCAAVYGSDIGQNLRQHFSRKLFDGQPDAFI